MTRRADLDRFYGLLDQLRNRLGGYRRLRDCTGKSGWPDRGVYFFFEDGEFREDGKTLRVVRVGTHAVTTTSRTKLWKRLSAHRGNPGGTKPGGGNHRGSIFRLHVGTALLNQASYPEPVASSWGRGQSAAADIRGPEYPLERDVSGVIGSMPFLWLDVPDAPGPESHRAIIEMYGVGLVSNHGRPAIDPASSSWLGRKANRSHIRDSGLWNVNFVEGSHAPEFLDTLQLHVESRRLRP